MVREGVRQAVGFAHDPTGPREARIQSFDPTLVVRESTAPPAILVPTTARDRAASA
jgi:hypothetical protein